MVGAVPSTLHQKVKFVTNENQITVVVEEDMVVTTIVLTPYIDATECSFRSFEVATTTNIKDRKSVV